MPSNAPTSTSSQWCRLSIMRETPIMVAPNSGDILRNTFQNAPFFPSGLSFPQRYKERNIPPANAVDVCPDGKERRPSRMDSASPVQVSWALGWQRSRKSGRRRPTVTLIKFVAKKVSERLSNNPSAAWWKSWPLWTQIWDSPMMARGMPAESPPARAVDMVLSWRDCAIEGSFSEKLRLGGSMSRRANPPPATAKDAPQSMR